MPRGSPSIVGPVSTATTAVIVVGQYEGSTLTILQGTKEVGRLDHARGGEAQVAIDQTLLQAGEKLVATQRVGAETSPPSPKGVNVEKALLGPLSAPFPIYACAESFSVTNCCPGAIVEVRQGNFIVGSARAVGDVAKILRNTAGVLDVSKPVTLSQHIPPSGVSFETNLDAPTAPPRPLAPPTFDQPVQRCQIELQLSGIAPGAHVQVFRDGANIFDQSVPGSILRLRVGALNEGETITAIQSLPLCKLTSHQSSVVVAPLTALVPPFVDGQLCVGGRRLRLSRLQPGAEVILFANGQELGRYIAGSRELSIEVTLAADTKITAQQSLCGIISAKSRELLVDGHGAGRWFLVEDSDGNNLKATAFAVHAALMRTGQIVMFSGDQHWSQADTCN